MTVFFREALLGLVTPSRKGPCFGKPPLFVLLPSPLCFSGGIRPLLLLDRLGVLKAYSVNTPWDTMHAPNLNRTQNTTQNYNSGKLQIILRARRVTWFGFGVACPSQPSRLLSEGSGTSCSCWDCFGANAWCSGLLRVVDLRCGI